MQSENKTAIRRAPKLCDSATCTGCAACMNICPTGAISMQPDSEGFYRPTIDASKCIRCLKCEKICLVITPLTPNAESDKIFAAWHRYPSIRACSSSGGAFSALAQMVLKDGGCVVGASFDDRLHLSHVIISSLENLHKLRASKYLQSEISDIFQQMKTYLNDGRKVLFCGTPCQVAGVKSYFGSKYGENLILVDFVCHGVPSPLFFKKYIAWLSPKVGNIHDYLFRNKDKGWYDATRVISTDSNSERRLKGRLDAYWTGFMDNLCLQETCYKCPFVGIQRNSDITIADFWGIGKQFKFKTPEEIEKGISMVMCNTPEGLNLFNSASEYLEFQERTMEEVVSGNQTIVRPCVRPARRDTFYRDLDEMEFQKFTEAYLTPSLKARIVKFMREYLPGCIMMKIRQL